MLLYIVQPSAIRASHFPAASASLDETLLPLIVFGIEGPRKIFKITQGPGSQLKPSAEFFSHTATTTFCVPRLLSADRPEQQAACTMRVPSRTTRSLASALRLDAVGRIRLPSHRLSPGLRGVLTELGFGHLSLLPRSSVPGVFHRRTYWQYCHSGPLLRLQRAIASAPPPCTATARALSCYRPSPNLVFHAPILSEARTASQSVKVDREAECMACIPAPRYMLSLNLDTQLKGIERGGVQAASAISACFGRAVGGDGLPASAP